MSRTVANWTVNYVHEGTPHVNLFKLFFMLLRHQLRSLHGTPSNNEILIFFCWNQSQKAHFWPPFFTLTVPIVCKNSPHQCFAALMTSCSQLQGITGVPCVYFLTCNSREIRRLPVLACEEKDTGNEKRHGLTDGQTEGGREEMHGNCPWENGPWGTVNGTKWTGQQPELTQRGC